MQCDEYGYRFSIPPSRFPSVLSLCKNLADARFQLKSEVTLVEKQDYALLKSENERLLSDVEKLKQRLREEVSKTSAGVRLDLNLEKGRVRDELGQRELKIREVDTKLESEISAMKGGRALFCLCLVRC